MQQRRAQELSDQMRIEEIERQLRAQHIAAQLQGNRQSPFDQHRRLPSGHGGVGTLADLHGQLIAEQQRAAARRQRSQSPFQITPEMLQMPQERPHLQQWPPTQLVSRPRPAARSHGRKGGFLFQQATIQVIRRTLRYECSYCLDGRRDFAPPSQRQVPRELENDAGGTAPTT